MNSKRNRRMDGADALAKRSEGQLTLTYEKVRALRRLESQLREEAGNIGRFNPIKKRKDIKLITPLINRLNFEADTFQKACEIVLKNV